MRGAQILRAPNWVQRLVAIAAAGATIAYTEARPAVATEIVVTSTASIRGGPDCTLRDAITAANLDTATGGCPAGSGADTIALMSGATYLLDDVDTAGVTQPNGLPAISTDITIVGNGATTIARRHAGLPPGVDAQQTPPFRLLQVLSAGRLTLNGLTLTGGLLPGSPEVNASLTTGEGGAVYNAGTLTLTEVTVIGNSAEYSGGGIFNGATATLTLIESTVTNNQANDGGGIDNAGILVLAHGVLNGNVAFDAGGGIRNTGSLTLVDCTLNQNWDNCDDGIEGGALYNTGIATLTRCVLTDNSMEDEGGAIFNDAAGSLIVSESVFAGNFAGDGDGGAIYNLGAATLTNCTLRDNAALSGGGGGGAIVNDGLLTLTGCTLQGNSGQDGGGIVNVGTSALTNCTLVGNRAGESGGGGVANFGALTVTNCTLSDNDGGHGPGAILSSSDETAINNTIIGNQTNDPDYGNCSGPILGNGHNVVTDDTCGSSQALVVADPLLAPLGDYGGPTNTMALCTAVGVPVVSCGGRSPAIDAGDDGAFVGPVLYQATDQRGLPRVSGQQIDVGAFEVQQPASNMCIGDCNGDGSVTISDLLSLVEITLGAADEQTCTRGDENGDGAVTIAEIVVAVNNALRGCGVG